MSLRKLIASLGFVWNRIADFFAWAFDILLLPLVFFVSPDIKWSEIQNGRCDLSLFSSPPSGTLVKDQAQFLYQQQQEAAEHTDAKVRQLLTLSSALATLAIGYLSTRLRLLVFPPLAASIYICVELLSVRVGAVPELSSGADNLEQSWTRDLMTATRRNSAVHTYSAKLYRAAFNWFLIALILAICGGLVGSGTLQNLKHQQSPNAAKAMSTRLPSPLSMERSGC